MSEFEKTISSEDLTSMNPTSEIISIPIRTKSSSNVIEMVSSATSSRISPRKKFFSMDDIFDASVNLQNAPLGVRMKLPFKTKKPSLVWVITKMRVRHKIEMKWIVHAIYYCHSLTLAQ